MTAILAAVLATSCTAPDDGPGLGIVVGPKGGSDGSLSVCNNSGEDLWFAMTVTTPSCGLDGFSDSGWYFLRKCSCTSLWNGDATNIDFFWSANNRFGNHVWGSSDRPELTWPVLQNGHANMCHADSLAYCDVNPVTACASRPHNESFSVFRHAVLTIQQFGNFRLDQSCVEAPQPDDADVVACSNLGTCVGD